MKKALVIILLFTILAVTFTATMINIQKNSETYVINTPSNIENITTNNSSKIEYMYDYEKTLDLFSTYKTPAIKFVDEEVNLGINYGIQTIPQLRGLKNKSVENKINTDINNRFLESIQKYEAEKGAVAENLEFQIEIVGEFPNVISAIGRWSKNSIRLNYELVTGERLHLEDLFVKDYDVKLFISQAVYKAFEDMEKYDEFDGGETHFMNIHYDYNLNEWRGEIEKYNENIGDYEYIESTYIPSYTDYELSKIINKAYKNKDDFYLYSNVILINVEGLSWGYENLYFSDYANKIVLFDKYVTKESIYEDDSLSKNLIVCNSDSLYGVDYKETQFEGKDLFYDITIGFSEDGYRFAGREYGDSGYPLDVTEKMLLLEEELIKNAKEKIDEYKNKIRSDKSYIILFQGSLIAKDPELGYYTNLIKNELLMQVLEFNKMDYDLIMKSFLEDFRYRNVDYYGGSYRYCGSVYFEGDYLMLEESELISKYYDVLSDKFVENMENANMVALCPVINGLSNYYEFESDEIWDEVKRDWIQASDDFEYAKYRLKDYNNDTLNIIYNEFFARHGHDFKSQELKDYFSLFDWYKPVEGKKVGMNELSEIERKNAEMILKVIQDRKSKE